MGSPFYAHFPLSLSHTHIHYNSWSTHVAHNPFGGPLLRHLLFGLWTLLHFCVVEHAWIQTTLGRHSLSPFDHVLKFLPLTSLVRSSAMVWKQKVKKILHKPCYDPIPEKLLLQVWHTIQLKALQIFSCQTWVSIVGIFSGRISLSLFLSLVLSFISSLCLPDPTTHFVPILFQHNTLIPEDAQFLTTSFLLIKCVK